MTERRLPATAFPPFALPARTPHGDAGAARPVAAARPATTSRPATASRVGILPAHVGVMLGLSTGAYALSLALVTGLQSSTEAAQASDRAPVVASIAVLSAQHDRLEGDLAAAKAAYESAAAAYSGTGAAFQALEQQLGQLSAAVAEINGTAAALPAGIKLPSVSRTVSSAAAPATHATTSASGAVVP